MSELKKRPLIIDCDPGTDDAICIFMVLAQEQFDVLGICPVNGNKPLAVCEKNALMLMELTGRQDIPVLKGANKGLFREQRDAGAIHGAGGLGEAVLPEPKKQLEEKAEKGHVILDIEPNGAFAVRKSRPDAVLIFIMPPSVEELESRLRSRGDTSEEQIRMRLDRARWEMDQRVHYDHVVVNDRVEDCAQQILRIIARAAD